MDPTLIFVVPIGLVELQVFPSVVDFPVRFKPTRLFQFFFKITENIFDVFHAVMKELKKTGFSKEQDLMDILELYHIDVRILGDEYRDKEFTGKDICRKRDIELFFNKRDHRFSTSGLRKACAWINKDGDWKMTQEG